MTGFFFPGLSSPVGVYRPIMQRTDPRRYVGEGLDDHDVIKTKNFRAQSISAEAWAETGNRIVAVSEITTQHIYYSRTRTHLRRDGKEKCWRVGGS